MKQVLSPEEMERRFTELRALAAKQETIQSIQQKWQARGHPISVTMVRLYLSKIQKFDRLGMNIDEAAKVRTWSSIIWQL